MTVPRNVIPELDLARIQRYCDGRVPARLLDQIRIELEVRGRSVTILERRYEQFRQAAG